MSYTVFFLVLYSACQCISALYFVSRVYNKEEGECPILAQSALYSCCMGKSKVSDIHNLLFVPFHDIHNLLFRLVSGMTI